MSWKDKTFKEKKVFYKERQVFFDAVKSDKDGEDSVIKYSGEMYKLVSPVEFWEYVEDKWQGKCVIFSKAYKSNTIVDWWYSSRNGFRFDNEKGDKSRKDKENVLCFAEKI